jgi:predicted transcriptional regulator
MSMIRASTDQRWLPLYEALASEVRLRLLDILADGPLNVKDLAGQLQLSSAILSMHVRKLEQAGLIRTEMRRVNGGTHKLCRLAENEVSIRLPQEGGRERQYHEQTIPVGHYTSFEVQPTCGLATREKVIGQFDDPRYFLEPERVSAGILWFGQGYVEYKTPNYLLPGQTPTELEISVEIASEAPGINDTWPSDIRFYVNDVRLGEWTSPGDYGGETRGRYTPAWWNVNQYGLWKVIRVGEQGTYIDGQCISDTTIQDLKLEKHFWTLRFAVESDARHVGGLTLFGAGFGNYNQDIRFRVYYGE